MEPQNPVEVVASVQGENENMALIMYPISVFNNAKTIVSPIQAIRKPAFMVIESIAFLLCINVFLLYSAFEAF
jgi:hypothetical protein